MRATSALPPVTPGGVDDRLLPMPSGARRVVNMRWHESGFFVNDRGWEPLVPQGADHLYVESDLAPCRGLWCWTRQQGAEVYYLTERGGELGYDFGNDAGGTEAGSRVTLATDRHVPGVSDAGTQLVPCGRFALLLNGYDQPVKFYGGEVLTPFGFEQPPAPPLVIRVDPRIRSAIYADDGFTAANDDASALSLLVAIPPMLGNPVQGTTSSYSYRYSFVSETGSESPLSPEVTSSWSIGSELEDLAGASTYAVYLAHLPTGGNHVVARRLYRTKNMGDGADIDALQGEGRVYYLVAEIPDNATTSYVDTLADSRLVTRAPDLQESVEIPTGLRYGAVFDGRMWLGGGNNCPTRLLYSKRGAPEQFAAFDFYDLGGIGGEITGIAPHEGRLIIFRRRAIDVLEITEQLGYRLSTLSGLVGTTATNTVQDVPGYGLVFLAYDGVYAVGPAGPPVRISDAIGGEMKRIGAGSLPRATAVYSAREQEYWVQYPADGTVENVRGAVLHVGASAAGDGPVWSLRHITPTDTAGKYRMILTAMAANPDGWIVFGTSPIDVTATGAFPGGATIADIDTHVLENLGLQVWSARPAAGTAFTVTDVTIDEDGSSFEVSTADAGRLEALWQSEWKTFNQRTNVHYVEAWMLNTGKPGLTMEYAIDGREEWTAAPAVVMEPFETGGTAAVDHVYGLDTAAARQRYQATWGTSVWREDRLVRVKWDVHLPKGAAGSFAFRLRSKEPFAIAAYVVGANTTAVGTSSQVATRGGV